MERKNTEPLLNSEEFSELLIQSSFTDKFPNSAYLDILDGPVSNSTSTLPVENLPKVFKLEDEPWKSGFIFDYDTNIIPLVEGRYAKKLPSKLLEDDSTSSSDNEHLTDFERVPSLGFQSWLGHLNFSINFPATNSSNSKWCYNSEINKLYIMRTSSVPIEFTVDSWEEATINITPVFLKSQNISEVVMRCHNHRIADEARGISNAEYIIEVVNPDAVHKIVHGRYSAEISLGRPAPGERSRIIQIRSGCWNTCVGPSRRNYCVIFTLFGKNGREIGRQVVNFKSCQSPLRDMAMEKNRQAKSATKRKLRGGTKEVTKKVKNVNSPSKDTTLYESLLVPPDIAADVKKYINCLMAERFSKDNENFIPPYPEY